MDQSQNNSTPVQPSIETPNAIQQPPVSKDVERQKNTFDAIRHLTAWVMIASAIIFALIGILAIWNVFGQNAGDVVWRAFSSLGIIAFAALIVNVAARMSENNR